MAQYFLHLRIIFGLFSSIKAAIQSTDWINFFNTSTSSKNEAILYVAQMIENIKFRNYSDKFINMVEEDKKRIRTSQCVFIPADKTRNMDEMSAPAYNKLVAENVAKTYKLQMQTPQKTSTPNSRTSPPI